MQCFELPGSIAAALNARLSDKNMTMSMGREI